MKTLIFVLSLLPGLASALTIPSVYYLYRQSPDYGHMMRPAVAITHYQWAGACMSCSLQTFQFSKGMPLASKARLLVYWINSSPHTRIAIVALNGNGTNLRVLAELPAEYSGSPRYVLYNFRDVFNDLVRSGVDTQIGYMVAGDPANPPKFFVVKLEVDWELP